MPQVWKSIRFLLTRTSTDENGIQGTSVQSYNVQSIPTFFLIDRNNTLQARDVQIKDIDAAIKNLL